MLVSLAALWGASYMLIKVALNDGVPPFVIVFARTALAALVLVPVAMRLDALSGLRGRIPAIALLALVQVAAPFVLITAGEQELPSALAGILIATAPIFTFLMAFAFEGEERAGRASLVGVAIGLAGAVVLLGVDAGGAIGGGLMVVLAAVGYAVGAWYLKRGFSDLKPMGVLAAHDDRDRADDAAVRGDQAARRGAAARRPGRDRRRLACSAPASPSCSSTRWSPSRARRRHRSWATSPPDSPWSTACSCSTSRSRSPRPPGWCWSSRGSWLAAGGHIGMRRRREPVSAAARGELAAGGVDVAPAGEAHGRA